MITKLSIPYKNCGNKLLWDFVTHINNQINNINLATTSESIEYNTDNLVYFIVEKSNSSLTLNLMVAFSQLLKNNTYNSCCDVWLTLQSIDNEDISFLNDNFIYIFSFDIKKYNSILSFSESYQNRDNVNIYVDFDNRKLYYKISNSDYVDVSPIIPSKEIEQIIKTSYSAYKKLKLEDSLPLLCVDSVDKNSFLLPYMSYKDFLNFSVFSSECMTKLSVVNTKQYLINYLNDTENNKVFYLKTNLRNDKFKFSSTEDANYSINAGFWQLLVILQHYKAWHDLKHYLCTSYTKEYSCLNLGNITNSSVYFIYNRNYVVSDTDDNFNKTDYQLVGEVCSSELFKLNKLYSNANRNCYFDFSIQVLVGNNYIFNDDKLEQKETLLDTQVNSSIPLKMTFTELKHYIGSDLSQKNFILKIYTDGIRVMLERWNENNVDIECRVIFNHTMSKKNQGLPQSI